MLDPQAQSLHTRPGLRPTAHPRRAFSLIDLLVSMAVVATLIVIMVPSLSSVRESARRVVCSSNIRQIGLGLGMYSDDYRGKFPPSKFVLAVTVTGPGTTQQVPYPQHMMIVRTVDGPDAWDGLGVLYFSGYLDAPGVFYCPSHHGDHPFTRYAPAWSGQEGVIVSNYHFRGDLQAAPDVARDNQALVADGMASRSDYNHRVGANLLRADFTVSWFADVGGVVASLLPQNEGDPLAGLKIGNAWDQMDQSPRR